MKAQQTEQTIPEFTQNDAILMETLVKIHGLMWATPVSTVHKHINRAKLDQLMLYLLAAPEHLLPSC